MRDENIKKTNKIMEERKVEGNKMGRSKENIKEEKNRKRVENRKD